MTDHITRDALALSARLERIESRLEMLEQLTPPASEQRSHVEAHKELERRVSALEGLGPVPPLMEGEYELVLRVRARVIEVGEDGASYELELDPRQFYGGRTFAVDHDEIVEARRRE